MKKNIFTIICVCIAIITFSQRTIVAPINPPRIFPRWVGGDRDFWGHGPRVTGDIRIEISEGRSQLIAFINLRLQETEGDRSAATIDETRLVYNAPAGRQIRAIITPAVASSHFDNVLVRGGMNRVNAPRGGVVSHLLVNGDTGGLDIGNNTEDDCHVSVVFAGMVVELEPLAAGVREITVPKTVFSGVLSGQLRGTTGRINTYGPRRGDSWFLEGDSWIQFPAAIRSDRIVFDQLQEIRILPRRYYYNDINLRSITARASGQYIRIMVNWESDGPEIRGECVDDAGCMFGTPTVQLDNFGINIDVRPIAAGGRLTYDGFDTQVNFAYNYSADCGVLTALCTELFKDPLMNAFFKTKFLLAEVLNTVETRNQISVALTNGVLDFVHSFGRFPEATQIVDVADRGNNLVIRCR
jgi:hypothetical protein